MKNWFASICLLLLALSSARAENVVTVSTAEGKPGETVSISVSLTNTDDIVAAEFSIPLGKDNQYVEGSFTMQENRLKDHTVKASVKDGALNVYLFSSTFSPLPKASGELFTFRTKLGKAPQAQIIEPTVILSNAEGKKLTCTTVNGSVTTLGALIACDTLIDFGRVAIRDSYTKALQVTNTGTSKLEISSITSSSAAISVDNAPISIAPGEKKDISIVYKPVSRGTLDDKLVIASNIAAGDTKVALKADAYSVNEIHIGSASGEMGSEVTVPLSLDNMEDLSAIQFSLPLPEEISYVEGSFKPADRCSDLSSSTKYADNLLSIYLFTLSAGKTIKEGKGEIGTIRLKLRGKSGNYPLTPADVVLGNMDLENLASGTSDGMVTIASPALSCSDSFVMEPRSISGQNAVWKFPIENTGLKDLCIKDIQFESEEFSVIETLPITIAAGGRKEITIRHSAKSAGKYSTTMKIYSDDPSAAFISVNVSDSIIEPNSLYILKDSSQKNTIIVGMDNYNPVVAMQMMIEGISTKPTITLNETCKGFESIVRQIEDNKYSISLYSKTLTPIQCNAGHLMNLSYEATSGQEITITDVTLSDESGNNIATVTTANPVLLYDANGDKKQDEKDIDATVNHLIELGSSTFSMGAADVNGDGRITVSDLTSIISKILLSK